MSRLSLYYTPLRMLLGDRNEDLHIYEDASLRQALRAVIGMGRLEGYTLVNGLNDISPDIPNDGTGDPNKFALLLYHTAKLLAAPDQASYSFRTRALSESFGSQRDFLADLECNIHTLENGTHFASWQSFAGWYAGVTGVDLWAVNSKMVTSGVPFRTVTLTGNGTVATS